jgi:hypothetical protein
MSTARQIEANRHNALMSTGPRTVSGKGRSRRNALRHGLTAETVIEPLENAAEYEALEASIAGHYAPQTAVEHELVFRLASLFWRIRRATTIETGLLQIQAESFRERRGGRDGAAARDETVGDAGDSDDDTYESLQATAGYPGVDARDLTWSFLRLAHVDEGAFERLTRYEAVIWRQIAQTIFMLDTMRRR